MLKKKYLILFVILILAVTEKSQAISISPGYLNIQVGMTGIFTLSKGSGFYKVISSDKSIATTVHSNDIITVTGKSKGTALITVTDNINSIKVGVSVGQVGVSAGKVYLLKGSSDTITISQGTPPYSVVGSKNVNAKLKSTGTEVEITGLAKGSGTVTVTDSNSDSVTVNVIIYSSMQADKTKLFMAPNMSDSITITGGVPPYTVSSSDKSVASASVNGAKITIAGKAVGNPVITVLDSQTSPEKITINIDIKALNVTAKLLQIINGGSKSLDIMGKGNYTVSVKNSMVAKASISSSSKLNVKGLTDGRTKVTISDKSGNSIDMDILVYSPMTISPLSLTMEDGAAKSFVIKNGVMPFSVKSQVPGIVDVPAKVGAFPVDVKGRLNGQTVLTITDAIGASKNISVTVLKAPLSVNKKSLSVSKGSLDKTISVAAGTSYYNAHSSDPSIAKAYIGINDELVIEGIDVGKTRAIINDSGSGSLFIDVTVLMPSPKLTYSINSTSLTMQWTNVSNADSYVLYFTRPDSKGNPDVNKVSKQDMGKQNSVIVGLNSGDIYFVAIQAVNFLKPDISSEISKAEKIVIP